MPNWLSAWGFGGEFVVADGGGSAGTTFVSHSRRSPVARTAFTGLRFPAAAIAVAVYWYLRYGLPPATWRNCWLSAGLRSIMSPSAGGVRRFTPPFADAAR